MEYDNINLRRVLSIAIKAAKEAGEILLEHWNTEKKIKLKERYDIVTDVDLIAQKRIISIISNSFPDHFIKSEENKTYTNSKQFENMWIIDPLDGTINYVHGIPLFSVSIAFQKSGETLVGVIYDPLRDELYHAIKHNGSYLNGNKINVSERTELSESIISFMLTSHFSNYHINLTLEIIREISKKVRGVRLLVSQAIELAYLASGRIDGVLSVKSRGFSSAAGALLVREAGGTVTDFNNKKFNNKSKNILATNSKLHNQLLNLISSILKTHR